MRRGKERVGRGKRIERREEKRGGKGRRGKGMGRREREGGWRGENKEILRGEDSKIQRSYHVSEHVSSFHHILQL